MSELLDIILVLYFIFWNNKTCIYDISVIETIPKIIVDKTEYRVKKGEDVTIEVKFTATPPPQAEWSVNGTVIQKSKRVGLII